MKKWLNLPNQLTLSRIIIVPLLLIFLYIDKQWSCLVAAFLFFFAGVTDLFDGYLARRANQVTSLGKFLDPLADKILANSILIMLVELDRVNVWVAIIIICRDIMVDGLRSIAAESGIVIAADRYGKIKTIVLLVALMPLIIYYPLFGLPMAKIGIVLLYVALALTIFSGINYFVAFWREQRQVDMQEK